MSVLGLDHHHALTNDFRETEKRELFIALSLRALGLNVVGIFIPIFLYQLGYGIRGIVIFMLLQQLFRLGIGPLGAFVAAKRGPNHLLAAGLVAVIVQVMLFYSLPSLHWPLWVLAVFCAATDCWYLMGFGIIFSKIKNRGHGGQQAAAINEVISIVTALAPLIGGLIGTHFGLRYSFAIALIVLVAGAVPLLLTRELPSQHDFSRQRLKTVLPGRDFWAAFGKGTDNMATTIFWPLAIFLIVGSYASVGIIASIGLILALGVSRIVGRLTDSSHRRGVMNAGIATTAGIHLLRIVATTTAGIFVVNTLDDVLNWLLQIPWQASLFRLVDEGGRLEYLTGVELGGTCGRLVYWGILVPVAWYCSLRTTITVGFILSAVGVTLVANLRSAKL